MNNKKIATREAYGQALVTLGEKNPNVVVLDADLAKSTKTIDFKKCYPERFFDFGIAEQNMLGTAAGLAAAGKIPFCSTFAVFVPGRAFDQIRNGIAYPRLNVKIGASHAGITVGEDGASHQAIEDLALMRVVPGMTIFVPADALQTRGAVQAAVEINGPVYIRLGRTGVPVLPQKEDFVFQPGKAVLLRQGYDATIIATGIMTHQALIAAQALAQEGKQVRVLNIHTLKPLDVEAIVKAAKETRFLVTAEEHSIIGGLGSAVTEVTSEYYPVPVKRIGLPDVFGESGKAEELLEKYGLTPENLIATVKKLIYKK